MDLTREWEKWPPRTQRREEVPGPSTTNTTTHQDKTSKILGTTSTATIGTTTELTTTITAESKGEDDPQPLYFYFYQSLSKFKNHPARTNTPPIRFLKIFVFVQRFNPKISALFYTLISLFLTHPPEEMKQGAQIGQGDVLGGRDG